MAKLTDYTPLTKNPNKGSKRGNDLLETSLEQGGIGRSIVVAANGDILGGNHVTEKVGALFGDVNVVEVPTDGNTLVVVKRTDIASANDPKGKHLILGDNRASDFIEYDLEVLKEFEPEVLNEYFFGEELAELGETEPETLTDEDMEGETEPFTPNAQFVTDNDFDIPTLELLYPEYLEPPMIPWGAFKRSEKFMGTICFYTDDYRFEAIWDNPHAVTQTTCAAIVEPNFSCYPQTPRALVLWQIFRKRWLARFWQSLGVPVLVDLNVAPNYYEDNLLGVPSGYQAFCTRGYSDKLDYTDLEYEQARTIAGGKPKLFVVYGGGKVVKAHCQEKGYLWIQEEMDSGRKGKING